MTTLEQKLAQHIGALMLENIKLAQLVEDLRAQLAKAQEPKTNGIDHHIEAVN
jgi:hypothetical protein